MENLKNRIKDIIENTDIDLDYDGVEDMTNELINAVKEFESNKNDSKHNVKVVLKCPECGSQAVRQHKITKVIECIPCGTIKF